MLGLRSELIGSCAPCRPSHEAMAGNKFRAAVERLTMPRARTKARGADRDRHLPVFASVVLVLWVGAQDVMRAKSRRQAWQFVLYAWFAAGGWAIEPGLGEIAQASGGERLFEF